jgi:hypothetical protein
MAIFGDPVRITLGAKPTTWLYFQDATTCVRFVPADSLDARGYAEILMWDGREKGSCHFD